MTQLGWDIGGRLVSQEEVAEHAKREPFLGPWPVAVLLHQTEDLPQDWRFVRASELGRCLRQRALRSVEPFFVRPDSVWMALVGRGLHRELSENLRANLDEGDALVEVRLEHPFEVAGESLVISGQVDFYHRPSRTIVDYKGTGSLYRKGVPLWSYIVQQNVYAQLLRWQGEDPQRAVLWYAKFEVVKGRVQSLAVDVPLWEERDVLALLTELGQLVVLAHRDGVLPPPFQEGDEGFWQCRYCPVADVCRELERRGE